MKQSRQSTFAVRNPLAGETGNTQRILLLVLLLLVAAGGYLYFFTGLIRPPQESVSAPPVAAPAKQPIPPRPAQPAGAQPATAPAPAKPEAPAAKPAAPAPAPAPASKPAPVPAPAAKPTPAPAAKPVPAPAAKPAPAPAAKPAPAPAAKPAPAKAEPAPAKPAAAAKPAAPAKPAAKGAPAEQKPVAKKEEKAPAAPAKPVAAVKPVGAKAAKVAAGPYTLVIGSYVVEKAMETDRAKLKKAGLVPVVKKGEPRQEPMNRLFVASFANQDEATAELNKLRQVTKDGFILPEGGTYSVYAGSYYLEGRAAVEQDRLNAKGIKLVMKKVTVTVPHLQLTAGRFATREAAHKEAERLKKLGLTATVAGPK